MAEIPLFPLPLVFFPGGRLPLQIFETRYLDMVKQCVKDKTGFGVVLIDEGDHVLRDQESQLPTIRHTGTYGTIVDFDQRDNGMLSILVEGQVKFVIRDHYEQADRLMLGDVEFLATEEAVALPDHQQHLSELLKALMEHDNVSQLNLQVDYERATDVGCRLAELVRSPLDFQQRLLEMKDPLRRVDAVEKLIQKIQEQPRE